MAIFWYAYVMEISDIKKLTPYSDINDVLATLSKGVERIIGDNLIGLYLTGSLTYGDFNMGSSDIDFLVILKNPLTTEEFEKIKIMHEKIGQTYPTWAKRMEGSYLTESMLNEVDAPEKPKIARPYFNEGKFWEPNPQYGNEWTLNLYVLYEKGVALIGKSPKEILSPVSIEAVREASRRDLYEEWIPKLNDDVFFKNSHYKAYLVLTLCRILYRATHAEVASKKVASAWAKKEFGKPWDKLIEAAENWEHGTEMDMTKEIKEFVKFVANKIS